MCYKLLDNADHFFTKALRVSYVASRLDNIPIERALSRLGPRALNLYKIAQNVFNHLSTIYSDLYRVIMAKAKFKALEQDTIPFCEFYTKFDYLANLYRYVDQTLLKEELNYKLNSTLQVYVYNLLIIMAFFPIILSTKNAIQGRDDQKRANIFAKSSTIELLTLYNDAAAVLDSSQAIRGRHL